MKKTIQTACISLALFTLLLGGIYPLFVCGVGYFLFPKRTKGSLIYKEGKVVGSDSIGQAFKSPHHFHPRYSAVGYDGARSGGSNLGPTSRELIDLLRQRAMQFREENNLSPDALVPADAITASGSGLDPHISVANAYLQAPRVAKERNLSLEEVEKLIAKYTKGPTWRLFGEPRVHVLHLNLALRDIDIVDEAEDS